MKRRWMALAMVLVMLLTVTACKSKKKKSTAPTQDETVVAAVETLEKYWIEFYKQEQYEGEDGYFEIKNTRKIEIKDTVTGADADVAAEMFGDVDYIVEFVLYTEYYPQSYVSQAPLSDRVIVYDDGRMEVGRDLFKDYSARVYSFDYSGIVESVEDYGDKYNCKKNLKD